jgi:hypothetical protein
MPRHIYLGTNAPNFAPTGIGHHYIDTVAKKPYVSVGTTSSADWSEGGGGGAPLSPDDPLPIGSTPSPGISEEASAGDHVHEGLHSIAVAGEAQILGDAEIVAGTNVTLVQTGNQIEISASGGVESLGVQGDATVLTGAVKLNPGSNIGLVRIGNGIEISASAGRAWTTLTWSSTITIDASTYGGFTITLGGPTTIATPISASADKSIMFRLRQDGTGGRTVAWSSAWNFGADLYGLGVASSPNAYTYVGAIYNSTTAKWDVIAWARGY